MTEVEFHTGVRDRLAFVCRLLRKAYRQGARVAVSAPRPLLQQLDRELWTFEGRDFVPHVMAGAAPRAVAARTPIWLLDGALAEGHPTVLVNLGAEPSVDLGAFSRLIEVVSDEPEDAAQGRERWRAYKGRGLKIVHHAAGAARE